MAFAAMERSHDEAGQASASPRGTMYNTLKIKRLDGGYGWTLSRKAAVVEVGQVLQWRAEEFRSGRCEENDVLPFELQKKVQKKTLPALAERPGEPGHDQKPL